MDRYARSSIFNIKGGTATIGASAHVNLVGGVAGRGIPLQELYREHNVGHPAYVEYRSQCWGVRVAAESLEGINRRDGQLHLLGLGDLGRW